MAENREYLTQAEENGSVSISEEVVASIAVDAMKEIEGVGAMSQNVTEQLTGQLTGKKAVRGVRMEEQEGGIILDLFVMIRYGFAIPEVAQKVQESVSSAVGGMTGFPVKAVNVHVNGICFN